MIKIITACDNKLNHISELNKPIVEQYCNTNGYQLVSKTIENFDRPASWFKVGAILSEFEKNDCDHILWLDTDTLILKQSFKLESLLKQDKYFYLCKDANGINCGVFLMSNVPLMKDMLSAVDALYPKYQNHGWWEQAAIMELIRRNHLNINSHIEYVPQNILNAYDSKLVHTINNGYVNQDSFILHLPSINNTTRYNVIKQYISEYYGY
jgi:hypothetical protein